MLRYLPVLIAVGAAIYLAIWWLQSRGDRRRSAGGGSRPQPRAPRRPVAPDDDPEFLAELDRRSRAQRRRRESEAGTAGAPQDDLADDARAADTPGGQGPTRGTGGRADGAASGGATTPERAGGARPEDADRPSGDAAPPADEPTHLPEAQPEGRPEGRDGDSAR